MQKLKIGILLSGEIRSLDRGFDSINRATITLDGKDIDAEKIYFIHTWINNHKTKNSCPRPNNTTTVSDNRYVLEKVCPKRFIIECPKALNDRQSYMWHGISSCFKIADEDLDFYVRWRSDCEVTNLVLDSKKCVFNNADFGGGDVSDHRRLNDWFFSVPNKLFSRFKHIDSYYAKNNPLTPEETLKNFMLSVLSGDYVLGEFGARLINHD